MKKKVKGGFIDIGGVNYYSKTTYGRHKVILTRTMPFNMIEIKFIHNGKCETVRIDDSELAFTED